MGWRVVNPSGRASPESPSARPAALVHLASQHASRRRPDCRGTRVGAAGWRVAGGHDVARRMPKVKRRSTSRHAPRRTPRGHRSRARGGGVWRRRTCGGWRHAAGARRRAAACSCGGWRCTPTPHLHLGCGWERRRVGAARRGAARRGGVAARGGAQRSSGPMRLDHDARRAPPRRASQCGRMRQRQRTACAPAGSHATGGGERRRANVGGARGCAERSRAAPHPTPAARVAFATPRPSWHRSHEKFVRDPRAFSRRAGRRGGRKRTVRFRSARFVFFVKYRSVPSFVKIQKEGTVQYMYS